MTYIVFLLISSLHLFLLSHLQFTAWPEMLSYPFLLSHGFNLYKDIALPYQPLLPLILLSFYKIFGYTLLNLKLFTLSTILLSDLFIFCISNQLIKNKFLKLIPAIFYIFVQSLMDGNMLWFDLATAPFILAGIYILIKFSSLKRLFWFGLFVSLAFFIKQQIAVPILFMLIYLLLIKRLAEVKFFLMGLVTPAFFVGVYILFSKNLSDYFFWTFTVPLYWYPRFPGYTYFPTVKGLLTVLLLFLPGSLLALKDFKKSDSVPMMILLFFAGTFITAFPRFEYFRFQPAIALYAIILIFTMAGMKPKKLIVFCLPIFLSVLILLKSSLPFLNLPARFYGDKDLRMANKIKEMTTGEDKIYLLGESSTAYVLSDRLPPKPWIDNYVWYMEIEGMQEKVIEGFKLKPPKLIFRRKTTLGNWFDLGTYQPKKLVQYIEQNYHRLDTMEEVEIWIKN